MSKHSGHTLPGVEVKDADGFIGAAGGHVLTRGIDLNLPHPTQKSLLVSLSLYMCVYIYIYRQKEKRCFNCGEKCYPEQTSIFTQRSFIEFFLFAAADVENPAERRKR